MICLRDIIYNRMDIKFDTPCVMMCGGELLNVNKKLSGYSTFRDGAKIVLQKSPVLVNLRECEVECKYYTPQVSYSYRYLPCVIFNCPKFLELAQILHSGRKML